MFNTKPAASAVQLEAVAADAGLRGDEGHGLYIVTLLIVQVTAWGDIVEAIETAGWDLEHFTVAPEGHAVAVFRRAKGL